MKMFAGLDVGFKRTAVSVIDERGGIIWRGVIDTHPTALTSARWRGALAKVGLESWSMSPWLARGTAHVGLCGGVHGCAARGRCNQEPVGEVGQSGCLCVGGDAAELGDPVQQTGTTFLVR